MKNFFPAGLNSILGMAGLTDVGEKASAAAAHIVEERSGGVGKFLQWLLLPLLFALGRWFLKNLEQPAREVSVSKVSVPEVSMPQIVVTVVEKVGVFSKKYFLPACSQSR